MATPPRFHWYVGVPELVRLGTAVRVSPYLVFPEIAILPVMFGTLEKTP